MNIIELAEKLKTGMQFRRKCWEDNDYLILSEGGIFTGALIDTDMVTATDWEIIEEKTAYQKWKDGIFPNPETDFLVKSWNAAIEHCLEVLYHGGLGVNGINYASEEIQKLIEK